MTNHVVHHVMLFFSNYTMYFAYKYKPVFKFLKCRERLKDDSRINYFWFLFENMKLIFFI